MHKFTRKAIAVTVGTVVLLSGAGVAFAYWTAGGSGTGTATTGDIVAIEAVQTSTVTAMAPGDSAQTLSGTFLNPNDGPVYVTTVTASIASVFQGGGVAVGCDATCLLYTSPSPRDGLLSRM